MVKTKSLKSKILAGALAFTMAFGCFSITPMSVYAHEEGEETNETGYHTDIAVPAGIEDGTYYGIQEVSNVMPGVADDHHPFSYMIEVAVTVEDETITDVEVTHIDQSTARDLDVDYMNWAVSDLSSMIGTGTEEKEFVTGVDSVSGATKSNLGIFRAVADALETQTTTPAFGTQELPENAVTADNAAYPAEGEGTTIKLNFDSSITNPENFVIYNADASAENAASNAYGGIRWTGGKVVNSKSASTAILSDADYDYDAATQTVTIYNTENTGVGAYSINMYDASGKYQDAYVTFELEDTSVAAGDITLENNTVKIAEGENATIADITKNVTSVEIDGVEYVTYTSNHGIYQTRSAGAAVIEENGFINLEASVNPIVPITEKDYNTTRGTNAAYPLGEAGTHEVTLNIAGYPEVTGTVVNNGVPVINFDTAEDDLLQSYEDEAGGAFIPAIDVHDENDPDKKIAYKLTSSNTSVAKVRAKNNAVSVKGSGSTVLTVTTTDPTYLTADAAAEMIITAPKGSVAYENDAVVIDTEKCGTKLSAYLNNATITVTGADGKAASYTAANVIDSATGKVNLDAAVRAGKKTTTVFPAYGEYTFVISYAGFEDIKGSVVKEKAAQTITTGKDSYSKTFGNAAFDLNAAVEEDAALTYKSSNTKVATVNAEGKVTIKGAGNATITITAAETDNYKAATKKVTVKVAKASQTIKIKSATKTIKATAVKKAAKTYTFTTTGKKTTLKTAALTNAQKKAISKVTVSGNKVKVTVKKGAKKGTYKVKVYAKATANYKQSAAKTITIKIK